MADEYADQLCVLVIDDDPAVTEMIARVMIEEGHQVVTAASAEEGLESLPFYTFHIAFVDHNLPGMEGLVLGGYLLRNNPHMSVALITGESDPRIKQESVKLGLTFIEKPFMINELYDVIDHYLRSARERREQRMQESDQHHAPCFGDFVEDLAAYYSMPNVPDRITHQLEQRIKACLNDIRSTARYNERDRVAALGGLLTAKVLGVDLPKRKGGGTLYEFYDEIMEAHGRRMEFDSDSCKE